jgi:hypothetical protein
MSPFDLDKFYFWRNKSLYKYPWERRHLNVDFLKYEQKRIDDVKRWYDKFEKAKVGDTLEEVSYYVVPLEIDSNWKAEISLRNLNYIGVSALKNSLQIGLIVLLPKDQTIPKDYSLIKILKSKKDAIFPKNGTRGVYVIYAEEIQKLDSASIYVDVPYEKRSINKFFLENFGNDEVIADSFQPVISSSPYQVNYKGGISLSMFSGITSFSKEFTTTLKMMQPPEYSDIQAYLPKKVLDGRLQLFIKGIGFHVSEKNQLGKNYFSAFSSNKYKNLNEELIKRSVFRGEYSIACSLTPRGDNSEELMKDILSKFVNTEITRPFNTDELIEYDLDLKRVQKNIDEDIQLQIANQRQLKPSVNNDADILSLRKSLVQDWKGIAENLNIKNTGHRILSVYPTNSLNNIIKVAQSLARDLNKKEIDESIIKKSYKIFTENSDALVHSPQIQNNVMNVIPQRRDDEKTDSIIAELSVDCLDIDQLYYALQDIFKDIYEVQTYVDRLLKRGDIYEPTRGKYKSI